MKHALITFALCSTFLAGAGETRAPRISTLIGVKYPNTLSEGTEPVVTTARPLYLPEARRGFNDLLPYVLRSPDQEDAGTCLYMSLTGIAEWWMAKLHSSRSREPNGPIDFSERYFMNIADIPANNVEVKNWLTDSILALNQTHGLVRNKDYPFTKGWYKAGARGHVAAKPNEAGASYGASYNWIDGLAALTAKPVQLPKFSREVLFADPQRNQWNVGIAPSDIVEKIKAALTGKKAPVQVVYNHYGYWHSVFIVGYDDSQDNDQCAFTEGFLKHMQTTADGLREDARDAATDTQRQNLLFRAAKAQEAHDKANASYRTAGGCHPKGVFYVRDSIYADAKGPIYDYDPANKGEEAPYTMAIVTHEYDWVQHLANNVVQITAK